MSRLFDRFLILTAVLLLLLTFSVSAGDTSGTIGTSDIQWSFNAETGTLTISGTGIVSCSYPYTSDRPWKDYADEITSVVVEEGVTELTFAPFRSLKNVGVVELPATLCYVDNTGVFGSVSEFVLAEGNDYFEVQDGILVQTKKGGTTNYDDPNTMYPKLIRCPTNKTGELTLPESSRMAGYAFADCTGLTAVSLAQYSTISGNAFSGCTGLQSVEFPQTLTSIPDGAFYNCTALTDIVLPAKLKTVGASAFSGCASLRSVKGADALERIYANAFLGCSSLEEVSLSSVLEIQSKAFQNCTSLRKVALPEGMTHLGADAFNGCALLQELELPSTIKSIDISAFDNTILSGVTVREGGSYFSAEDGVLFDAAQSTLVWYPRTRYGTYSLPESVTHIGEKAFYECTGLTGITFSQALTEIGDYAFYNCTGLTTLEFFDNLTYIGVSAFYMPIDEDNIETVYFHGAAPTIDTNGFAKYVGGDDRTLYYIEGQEGWTTPFWNGYKTATWTPNAQSGYIVTFDTQGGIGGPGTQTQSFGQSLTISNIEPYKEGYSFLGWAIDSTATEADYQPGDTYTQETDATLYAIWQPLVYTVTFDANGGENAPEAIQKTHDITIELPVDEPVRTYYTFLGWSKNSSAASASYSAGGRYSLNGDTTLYAVWESVCYTVTYDANGGTGAPSAQTKTAGVDLMLPALTPTRNGFTFCGWASTPSATEEEYLPEDIYTEDNDLTLYAVWMPTVTGDDGMVTLSSASAKPGETVTLTASIENNQGMAGFIFEIRADMEIFSIASTDGELNITAGAVCKNGSLLSNTTATGWKIMWYHTNNVSANGELFSLELMVAEDAPHGEYTVELMYSPDDTVNVQGDMVPLTVIGADVIVRDVLLGDANGDGKVTNSDVIKMARSLIGLTTLTDQQKIAADVTGDGKITNSDVIKLARSLIGLASLN